MRSSSICHHCISIILVSSLIARCSILSRNVSLCVACGKFRNVRNSEQTIAQQASGPPRASSSFHPRIANRVALSNSGSTSSQISAVQPEAQIAVPPTVCASFQNPFRTPLRGSEISNFRIWNALIASISSSLWMIHYTARKFFVDTAED